MDISGTIGRGIVVFLACLAGASTWGGGGGGGAQRFNLWAQPLILGFVCFILGFECFILLTQRSILIASLRRYFTARGSWTTLLGPRKPPR